MITSAVQKPQSFVVSQAGILADVAIADRACQKVAWQHGFRRALGTDAGWAAFGFTTAEGTLHLAATATGRTARLVLAAWDRMEAGGEFARLGL